MPTDQVFILRFWLEEAGTNDHLQWRAQISNVNTHQRQLANDVDQAFALITDRLRAALSAEKDAPT